MTLRPYDRMQEIDAALVRDLGRGGVVLVLATAIIAFGAGYFVGRASADPFAVSGDCKVTQIDGRPIR